ncbi:MAG: hypothetical protein CFE33_17120 [Pseudorhodobacter sp. PARRP1]|nr:MAG: hypothetical protein CFE33_17120 [Pseudorhodobacter sp. PARRP1]
MAWASFVVGTLSIIQLQTFQIKIRDFSRNPGRFLAADVAISGLEASDLISPLRVGHYFRLNSWQQNTLGLLFFLFLLILFFPILACVALFLNSAFGQFGIDYGFFLENAAATCAILIIIFPVFYFILFFLPVSIKRSERGILASKFYRNRFKL